MAEKGLRFTLEVEGQPPETFAVVSFRLVQDYSVPFTLDVDVAGEGFRLTPEALLEKEAVLTILTGATMQRRMRGIVTHFGIRDYNGWQIRHQLIIRPPLWRAGLRQNFRIFQQQDIQSITATLLDENGVTDWTPCFYEHHPPREFCVQYGETDLAFLTRLWSEEGIFFFERQAHEGDKQTLVLCDNAAGLTTAGDMPFNPNHTTEAFTRCISAFSYLAQIRPSSVSTRDYTFKAPSWPGCFDREGDNLNGQYRQYEIFDYPGRFKDEQHGQDFARYQAEGWRSNAETASGESHSPALWPGAQVTLTGHPVPPLNRAWQIISSTLTGKQPQALKGSRGPGTTLDNQFSVIPGDRTWRPQPLLKPKVDGPQPAVVTGPPGEEIFCDEHGRVRVKFIWDRYHGENEDSSCWIRVSQAWAGAGFGNLAVPRVGQEVIVDFLNGDPDQPLIMGRTYHEDNRSPGDLPGTRTQMTIRSKTYQGSGFNELRFEDATGQEQVYIHAQKNMDTEVLNNRSTDVKVNHTETIGGNQVITVKQNQMQTVVQNQQENIGQNQSVTVGLNQAETVGVARALTVGVAYQTTVGGMMNTSVALMQASQVGIQKSLLVGKGYDVSVGENVTFTVGKNRQESAGRVAVYSAGEHLELRCGQARLVLTQDGSIFLNGTAINLQGVQTISGDSLMINWNCGATKNPPDAPE
ncbi:type VI secretion system Vgr family protein [Citrobacter rodentium]|uniref:Rhs protein n=2 Tax=Citrobacter rodentium TaxID=67825 RepID=D2TIK2_CITRI|nr:type VI secretion system tip protein TssI/VgrG [Citrobacter rodentium]KIQ52487.1 type IV secretion protein Rhs [Citrobacter rodentium]QBY29282.1 type VI secretion system tip protein VgrG [Citrobacter rodentium]UHO33311.1 type VI secretion system tip protein VgrG [Citrobacter rodentium NBRC 105723 = DSM 16636]CBG89561.1 putative Rhs protein [Citrobacter rodentium ICC168]HAT8015823.1 type VI secretion system tip protein VgrG [Citrobacter rodentium NBRC 105723 = DSM 16636]